jgi:hypothetical protein
MNEEAIKQLAERDFKKPGLNWNSEEWMPGEKEILYWYKDQKEACRTETESVQTEEKILKMAQVNALEAAHRNAKPGLIFEEESKQKMLEAKQEALQQKKKAAEDTIGFFEIAHPEYARIPEVEEKNEVAPRAPGKYAVNYHALGYILLILFGFFDAVNMRKNLNNYSYEPMRNLLIAAVIFAGVLYFSIRIKRQNNMSSWLAYLFFLILANVPQFMGKGHPQFALTNLTSSVSHVFVFMLSFVGSLVVTFVNRSGSGNNPQPAPSIQAEPEQPDAELAKYKMLKYRLKVIENDLYGVVREAEASRDKVALYRKDLSDGELKHNDEKVAALQVFSAELNKLKEKIKAIQRRKELLTEQCGEALRIYREEIGILKIIHAKDIDTRFRVIDPSTLLNP